MKTLVLVCLLSVVWVTLTMAQITYVKGPCPNGVKLGGVWYEAGCKKCKCLKDAYTCAGCPNMEFPANCIVTFENKGNNPDCCKPTFNCTKG